MANTVVLVLDVSGSMYGPPCESLQMAAWRYIDDAPDNQRIGVVLFDNKAWTAHTVVQLTSPQVRARLRQAVPQMDRGSTDIGGGLRQGLEALRAANLPTEGATIFLVTDGDNNYNGFVDQVLPALQTARVIVRCVAIGKDADENLERLADATGGDVGYIPEIRPEGREMAERVMSAAMRVVDTGSEMAEVVIIGVYNDIVTICEGCDEIVVPVPIDRDIGRNTSLQVLSHNIDLLAVSLRSPTGNVADEFVLDTITQRARLTVRHCEPGVWRLALTKKPGAIRTVIRAEVVVDSEIVANGSPAIELYVALRKPAANCPPLMVCRLDKAWSPVVGALLSATVDGPDGTQTHTPLDRYHTDGYYYNYFTDYSGAGRYNVSVSAISDGRNTTYQDNELGDFRRQRVANSFQLKQCPAPVPPDDSLFDQLVANGTFAKLSRNNTTMSSVNHVAQVAPVPVQPPAPRITPDMLTKRRALSAEYIRVVKAIKNSTLSETDKCAKLSQLADFDKYVTSTRNTTDTEIDSYRRRLVDMKNTL